MPDLTDSITLNVDTRHYTDDSERFTDTSALCAVVVSMDVGETREAPVPGVASVTRTGPWSATAVLVAPLGVLTITATLEVPDGE